MNIQTTNHRAILHACEDKLARLQQSCRTDEPLSEALLTTHPDVLEWATHYNQAHGVDSTAPLLSQSALDAIHKEMYEGLDDSWDQLDYLVVGVAGALAAIYDWVYAEDVEKWLKQVLNNNGGFGEVAKPLEGTCKTPYDAQPLDGMYPRSHRLQSLGHDPVAGFYFGVKDIQNGTLTGFSYTAGTGEHLLKTVQVGQGGIDLWTALLTHTGHLISDVGTPMGLPAPFMTLFQFCHVPVPTSGKHRTVAEIARYMYLKGYDLRAFMSQGVGPGTIEVMVRAYFYLRLYAEHGHTQFTVTPGQEARLHALLATAHGIACSSNAVKVLLQNGNPLSVNWPQWFAFVGHSIPTLRWELYGKREMAAKQGREIVRQKWVQIRAELNRMESVGSV